MNLANNVGKRFVVFCVRQLLDGTLPTRVIFRIFEKTFFFFLSETVDFDLVRMIGVQLPVVDRAKGTFANETTKLNKLCRLKQQNKYK